MPLISASTRTLQVKIVYYGPGLSGKTTNLEQLAQSLDPSRVGELMSLDTTGDRTLFFDWMPVELGKIKGFEVKVQLFTVPGQVRYNNTRKKVLQGADGVVFVADSQEEATEQNRFSFQNLRENLAGEGIDLEDIPLLIQWNKCDLPSALPPAVLAARLGLEHYPQVQAIASQGKGVGETLRQITQLTLSQVIRGLRMGTEPTEREASGPMDGEAMLDRIMAGDVGSGANSETGSREGPEVIIGLESAEDPVILGEPSYSEPAIGQALQSVTDDIQGLKRALRELAEQLPRKVSDLVEREVEPTAEKLADLESRLGILQRVVSRLGGRMDALERRVARIELQERGGRSEELREMAGHVHDLSRLMAAFARRLGHGVVSSDRQAGVSSEPVVEDNGPGSEDSRGKH
jgi:signal recognition particle receptor subunit beta